MKDQGGGLMSEDRFKCPRCSRNEKEGGWGKAQPAKGLSRERGQDQIGRALEAMLSFLVFILRAVGRVLI